MRFPFLRTVSSRIVLGFAVLIATFGWVSATTVINMNLVSEDIRILGEGYSELWLASKELSEKETDLYDYLKSDLAGEPTAARATAMLTRKRNARDKRIATIKEVLTRLHDLPAHHEEKLGYT